ncbi:MULTISPECIES: hypothetical protein [Spirosoma]|uniref:Uncharacterized protein n=1 Tax=Spirosoma liriopis TaxID=2937440 RepID=A0ABT0HP30_9BACT|nr:MULTISPECIES: hypothetical protein [Spirosoma]MCK8493935.1 hypothetical protein [Spirosoma liriopis]UHG93583.1 hypothetical protein LQ777_11910 [Spirosoma oryzicola]
MRQSLLILAVVISSILCLFGYCAALIDWIQDFQTGVYTTSYLEATFETAAILLYSYAGFFFLKRRVTL